MKHYILKAYSGYFLDKNKLIKSASGGLATAISEKMIGENAQIYGVKYSEDFKSSEFDFAKNLREIEKFKSSKYIQAKKNINSRSIFKEVKEKLENNQKILFIALPCEIYSLKKYLKKEYNKLYTIDLICHGPTYSLIAKEYIEEKEQEFNSKVKYLNVREKEKGWVSPFIKIIFENNKVFKQPFYESDYGKAFLIYPKLSCCSCKIKKDKHLSDLTIGDHWGIEKINKDYNKNGVSLALVRTQKGFELLNNLKDFYLEETDITWALKNNITVNFQRPIDRDKRKKFEILLKSKGLKKAIKEIEDTERNSH